MRFSDLVSDSLSFTRGMWVEESVTDTQTSQPFIIHYYQHEWVVEYLPYLVWSNNSGVADEKSINFGCFMSTNKSTFWVLTTF